MNIINQKKEQVIHEALRLLEQGESESSILETNPNSHTELISLFKIIHMVQNEKSTLYPSEALFKLTLDKLSSEIAIKSPYQQTNYQDLFTRHLSNSQKLGISSIIVAVFLIGGIFYGHHSMRYRDNSKNNKIIFSNDSSDVSFEQDMNAIDTQLDGLNVDNINANQSLDVQSS